MKSTHVSTTVCVAVNQLVQPDRAGASRLDWSARAITFVAQSGQGVSFRYKIRSPCTAQAVHPPVLCLFALESSSPTHHHSTTNTRPAPLHSRPPSLSRPKKSLGRHSPPFPSPSFSSSTFPHSAHTLLPLPLDSFTLFHFSFNLTLVS